MQHREVLDLWQLSLPAQTDRLGVSVATVKRQWKKRRDRGAYSLTIIGSHVAVLQGGNALLAHARPGDFAARGQRAM